ncbi:hypothetical protein M405DRAFT_749671 [Rhizopogon salebrosus TDB-379]|nr:hypothetical protein M405DRAFT_749671 [Rhizopogon salebrosus TDB-379]
MESYLSLLDDETADLALGVPTFDSKEQTMFDMHAYLIFKLGDIIAIQKFLGIKGVNAIVPCRSCNIIGVRGNGKTYYVPLQPPLDLPIVINHVTYDAANLPLRTHKEFEDVLAQITAAPTKAKKEKIAKAHGIRCYPALRRVGCLDYAHSLPWEWFHLFLENVLQNLVNLWTGQFKGLDSGDEDYEITPHIWEQVGEETAAAVQHIPSAFVRVLGNIASDRSQFTAESWCFWFIYLAPILLQGRFKKAKYYNHMCQLVDLMKIMLRLQVTTAEIVIIKNGLCEWVHRYEQCVIYTMLDLLIK